MPNIVRGYCSGDNLDKCPDPFYETDVCLNCGYCVKCCKTDGCQEV